MADDGGTVLLGRLDEVLDDQGAAQRRDQRVAVHVEGVRLDRREAVLVGELVTRVGHVRLDGAAVQSALADGGEVLPALAEVDSNGNDLGADRVGDPADGDRGVETSGICENYAVSHGDSLMLSSSARRRGCHRLYDDWWGLWGGFRGSVQSRLVSVVKRRCQVVGSSGRRAHHHEVGRGTCGDEELLALPSQARAHLLQRRCHPDGSIAAHPGHGIDQGLAFSYLDRTQLDKVTAQGRLSDVETVSRQDPQQLSL